MLYNLIGDTHGRDAWRQLVREDAVNVFLGDYLDPYGPEIRKSGESALQNLQAIVAYKEQHPETILLLGNHDLHYLWRECYSRYNYQCAKLFAEFFRQNWHHFKMAYAIGKRILVTHAGVTKPWCKLVGIPEDLSTEQLAAQLNQMANDDEQLQCFTSLFCGMDSAGYSASASPVWVRPETLMENGKLINEDSKQIVQIVGHTKTDNIQLTPPFFFVDCLATACQSLLVKYEDGGYDFDVYKPHIKTTIVPYRALVLNIPHASTNIPEEFMPPQMWHNRANSMHKYQEHARPLVDYYTDELFSVDDDKRIKPIVFDLCRTLCDVERMVNDPLEDEGYGIVCSKVMRHDPGATKCSVDYNPAQYRQNQSLLLRYLDYQHCLAKTIIKASYDKQQLRSKSVLLVDCHSFSSMPTALCDPGPAEEQVDICIGYNDDATLPSAGMIDLVVSHFEGFGYKVGRNTPFSHSKTVECPVPYHSLMIEVNKRCYMNEHTLEKTEGFNQLKEVIHGLYEKLLYRS
ncbi:MAG: N-formylglutamate amidohydrolase [Paludibacteraceae bacterium]|nr:N-formylglutamate amidohydrolase [Paludibacteraceae bacterium]